MEEIVEEMERRLEEMKEQLEEQARAMRKVLDKAEHAVAEIGRKEQEPSDGADTEEVLRRAEGAEVEPRDRNDRWQTSGETSGETNTDLVETPERTKSNPGCGRMHKEADEWRRNQEGAGPCDAGLGKGHF